MTQSDGDFTIIQPIISLVSLNEIQDKILPTILFLDGATFAVACDGVQDVDVTITISPT